MNSVVIILFIPVLVGPYLVHRFYNTEKNVSKFKKVLGVNITSFVLLLIFSFLMMTNMVQAAPVGAEIVTSSERGMAFLSAALATGMCTIGTGVATGMAAQSALAAISENENLMGKSLIYVALAEGVAIYGLLISFTILARV